MCRLMSGSTRRRRCRFPIPYPLPKIDRAHLPEESESFCGIGVCLPNPRGRDEGTGNRCDKEHTMAQQLNGRRIAILANDGVEEAEYTGPRKTSGVAGAHPQPTSTKTRE